MHTGVINYTRVPTAGLLFYFTVISNQRGTYPTAAKTDKRNELYNYQSPLRFTNFPSQSLALGIATTTLSGNKVAEYVRL